MASRRLQQLLNSDSIANFDWETVRTLLIKGANPNVSNVAGFTLLMAAVLRNEPDRIRWLLSHDVDVHQANHEGYSALLLASAHGFLDCIRCFPPDGCTDLTNSQVGNVTPLMMAAYYNHAGCVYQLLRMGANDELRDQVGRDALVWALTTPDSTFNPCQVLIEQHRAGKRHHRMRVLMTNLLNQI